MSEPDADLTDMFRDESCVRLDHMDTALLAIESGEAPGDCIDSLFRNAHTIKGSASMLGFDDISMVASAVEDLLAIGRDNERLPAGLTGPLLRATAVLRAQVAGAQEPVADLLDELSARAAALRDAGSADAGSADGAGEQAANLGPQESGETGRDDPGQPSERRLRIPASKIDHLLDVVGEVVQHGNLVAHSVGEQSCLPEEVTDLLSGGQRMLDGLRQTAVAMRTLRLGVITDGLPRAVRDLARAAGKEADLLVTGAETELDRVILESLREPLVHLLRNSITHGIEDAAERRRAGKPARGRLEVRATPRGSLVEIVVADDGRGVSPEVIDAARHEGSLADVLARPGYSTAGEVTDLAGRGVGLDAVKAYAQSVAGTFEVRSHPGRGMEVVLLLPVALALLRVLLVERGGAVYGLPLAAVEEVVGSSGSLALEGRAALDIRGRAVPVADIAALLGSAAPPLTDRAPSLVISAAGRRAVASCDHLLGEEEVVVKPLGPLFGYVDGYLGAAIIGDGQIALLLEPTALTRAPRRMAAVPPPPRSARASADQATGPGQPTGPGQAAGPGQATGPAAAPKVLVVEDSFTVRELQRSILEAAGYRVVTARDGRDALGILDHDSELALVVTDLEMPRLGGLGLTQAIRAARKRSSLPVVIVTSHGSEDDRRAGAEAGADAYVVKQSFDQHALLATVERLIGR